MSDFSHLTSLRRARIIGAATLLVAWAAGATAIAAAPPWTGKVHPHVLEAASEARGDSRIEFIVFLDEQADLGRSHLPGRERAAEVVTALQDVARRTQAPLISILDSSGAEYRALWIANMIWVRAEPAILAQLAARADVRRLDANPRIKSTEPASIEGPAKDAGAVEWNISQVRADAVWELGYNGQGVVIGGQDTGYEWDHPALLGQYRGWDGLTADHDHNWHDAIHSSTGPCPGDSASPCDDLGHGTHTMGTMVGDDGGTNRIGMAPGARWIGCRNMDQGSGTPFTYSECFQWFVAPTDSAGLNPDPSRAPHVINNSWTCPPSEGCSADALSAVVENTRAAGIVVVVSSGNAGPSCGTINDPPAIYETSFTVGATDSVDVIANFSSRGPITVDGSNRLKPDVSAPGVGVRSSVRNGGYAAFSGTSMSGPHVAGLVALLLSARPDLEGDVDTLEEMIRRSSVPLTTLDSCGGDVGTTLPNHTYGSGRIDALSLLTSDADGDAYSNLTDCAPLSADVWDSPGPATDLLLDAGSATELNWSAPAASGGTTLEYEVLRAADPAGFAEAICLTPAKSATSATDTVMPAGLFSYLVRTINECGTALGAASTGDIRTAAACE